MHNADVSSIVEYFVAPTTEAAAAVVDHGPDKSWDVRTYGNFDAYTAMIEWESILTGRTFDDVLGDGGPQSIGGPENGEGPVLFAASSALKRALSDATQAELTELRQRWIQEQAEEGEEFDDELVEGLLEDVADLARIAGDDRLLCCWWC